MQGSTVDRSSFERVAVLGFRRLGREEQALFFVIGLDQRHQFLITSAEPQIAQRLFVDREDAAGGAVFGRHIAYGRAIGKWQVVQTRAEELNELAHHSFLAQHLGHGQHEVGCGRALAQLALDAEADDLRDEHGNGLSEHGRLGLDTADAPSQNAQSVDHGGVRVGADQRVGICQRLVGFTLRSDKDDASKVFKINLVDDAGVRRHDGEVLERRLAPAEKCVAFLVALKLQLGVELQRLRCAELIHLHRVIDHQLGRLQRIDQLGIATQGLHCVAHGGEIDHGGNAGEVLQQYPARHEGDFAVGYGLWLPRSQRAHVVGFHGFAVFTT